MFNVDDSVRFAASPFNSVFPDIYRVVAVDNDGVTYRLDMGGGEYDIDALFLELAN